MRLTDDFVGKAINATEERLQGKEKKEKATVGGMVLRFIVSTIWFIITLVASLIAFYAMVAGQTATLLGDSRGKAICAIAIGLCFLIFLLTFIIPYLRKKGTFTRWCGIVALGDVLWWIYIMIAG